MDEDMDGLIDGLIDGLPDIVIDGSTGHAEHHVVLHAATKHFKAKFEERMSAGDQLPEPTSEQRGNIILLDEGGEDVPYICLKASSGYEWKKVQLGA